MKRSLAWIAIATLFAAAAEAQQNSRATAPGENAPSSLLEKGSMLYLELSKSLDARKVKPGDPVSAILLADVVSRGKVVLRADSKLLGHVTEAQAHTPETPESRLGIVFDKVIMKGGHEMPFSSVLIAVRAAPRLQVDSMTGPAPPGMNPAANPQPEKHYPSAKTPTVPLPASSKDLGTQEDRNLAARGGTDMTPTDIEGMSLEPSADRTNRIVISYKRTVKLESGTRLELRVLNSGPVQ